MNSLANTVLHTTTAGWKYVDRGCKFNCRLPDRARFIGFSIAADEPVNSGVIEISWNSTRLVLPLALAVDKKHLRLDGTQMPMKSPNEQIESHDLCAIMHDGEHPIFDLTSVIEEVVEGNIAITVYGPFGVTGIITLLSRLDKRSGQ